VPRARCATSSSWAGDFYQDADIEKALAAVNPTCNIHIFYVGSYGVHL
jgi:hypothetical protein